MSHCRRCGGAIRFAKRPGAKPCEPGAFVALEPKPEAGGLYAIVNDRVMLADRDTPKDAPRHHPHEAFCAAAGKPRRSALASEA